MEKCVKKTLSSPEKKLPLKKQPQPASLIRSWKEQNGLRANVPFVWPSLCQSFAFMPKPLQCWAAEGGRGWEQEPRCSEPNVSITSRPLGGTFSPLGYGEQGWSGSRRAVGDTMPGASRAYPNTKTIWESLKKKP